MPVLAWPVLHILGGPWGEVLGAGLQALGLAVVGLAALTRVDHPEVLVASPDARGTEAVA